MFWGHIIIHNTTIEKLFFSSQPPSTSAASTLLLNSLNLNLGGGCNSIRIASITIGTSITKTSITIGTSITKTSIRVASIGQGGGQDLGILSHAGSHQVVELILSVELASSSVRSSSTGVG